MLILTIRKCWRIFLKNIRPFDFMSLWVICQWLHIKKSTKMKFIKLFLLYGISWVMVFHWGSTKKQDLSFLSHPDMIIIWQKGYQNQYTPIHTQVIVKIHNNLFITWFIIAWFWIYDSLKMGLQKCFIQAFVVIFLYNLYIFLCLDATPLFGCLAYTLFRFFFPSNSVIKGWWYIVNLLAVLQFTCI